MSKVEKIQKGDYSDYWKEEEIEEKLIYYTHLYNKHKKAIVSFPSKSKIVDVGGGAGLFLKYLGIKKATVLDISSSGIKLAKKQGYASIQTDVRKRFPVKEGIFDVAYCFELLEHLHHPSKALVEINNILKNGGILFVGQPNTKVMPGHVRRIYIKELINDLRKSGFEIEWIWYIPGFNKRDSTIKKILEQPSLKRKTIQFLAYFLALIPYPIRSFLARKIPNRFALMYIVKCRKMIK